MQVDEFVFRSIRPLYCTDELNKKGVMMDSFLMLDKSSPLLRQVQKLLKGISLLLFPTKDQKV